MGSRSLTLVAAAALFVLTLSPRPGPRAQEPHILSAMRDELTRSMAELRLKGEPAPYYIDYQVDDVSAVRFAGRLGALLEDASARSRTLRVDVRVGDYVFDSSRFFFQGRGGGGGIVPLSADGSASAPLDEDYDAMRRQLWLVTDAAYKRAVGVFARKKAAFQNRAAPPPLPDFSREEPTATIIRGAASTPLSELREWASRVRELSAIFGTSPNIFSSDVVASETRGTSYFVTSEGATTTTPIQVASFRVSGDVQSDDGMVLRDGFSLVEKRLQDLPNVSLGPRIVEVVRRLDARRVAPIGDEFTGPVLLEGQASAEFVAEMLVPLMLGKRPPDVDSGRAGGPVTPGPTTPFLARIGLRVLPESFTASDTPSVVDYGGRPVPGAYVVDDEGVRAKDVTLVERGRLLTLLTGRTPLKNLPQSNGHGRNGVQAGVFQLQSERGVPARDLKQKYLDLLKLQDKPFGYIVRSIANPNDLPIATGPGGGPAIVDVVKVRQDGSEEPVRGIRFAGVPSGTFRDILEASEDRMLYSYRTSGTDAVSVIVPNLLFEELEIERTREVVQKPPIVPPPTP